MLPCWESPPISHLSKSFCTTIELPFKWLFSLKAELLATFFFLFWVLSPLMCRNTICCPCLWNAWVQHLFVVFLIRAGAEQPLDAEDNHSWDSHFGAGWVGCGRLWHTTPHHVARVWYRSNCVAYRFALRFQKVKEMLVWTWTITVVIWSIVQAT